MPQSRFEFGVEAVLRSQPKEAFIVLGMNTLAFTVCFAAWMMNGVLVTFLVDSGLHEWSKVQIGWLIGIPVLTGSITRLPVGILTDKYGGRRVYTVLMLLAAIPMYLLSYADSYWSFALASLGFDDQHSGLPDQRLYAGVFAHRLADEKRQQSGIGVCVSAPEDVLEVVVDSILA